MELITHSEFTEKINSYPDPAREKLLKLRKLVIETAEEIKDLDVLEETIKWGEPSFVTKNGSTLRMDWKEKTPSQYALYFQCTSRLVDTFRMVFHQSFQYEGNRAIVFGMNQKLPIEKLKKCIKATLRYHQVKQLSTLGM